MIGDSDQYDRQITNHFRLSEFNQPARPEWGFAFAASEPYPDIWINDRLDPLCDFLEEIRRVCGNRPMRILSGYRSALYNTELYRRAGKVPTDSQHTYGRAADIIVEGLRAGAVHAVVLDLYKAKKILIGGLGLYVGFVHVDIRPQIPMGHLSQWSGSRTLEQTA